MNVVLNKAATNATGLGRIKAFALLHGEKVAFGLVSLLTTMILYKSMTLPRLDKKYQAEALQNAIAQTKNVIATYRWEEAVNAKQVRQFRSVALIRDGDVNCALYDPQGGFGLDPRVLAPTAVRVDPPILNASHVYATGGTGMFAFVDEEVRKHHQIESAVREEERIHRERELQRRVENTSVVGRRSRTEDDASDLSVQTYDPEHPRRRPVDSSLHIPGVPLQGDERIERANWACVVALVPIREQFKLYLDSFEKARGYDVNRDFPRYLGFLVERADVVPGNRLEWQHVPLYDGQQRSIAANLPLSTGPRHAIGTSVVDSLYTVAAQLWAGRSSPDIVDERFTNRVLTLPLPPLVGRDWAKDATHRELRLNSRQPEAVAEQLPTTDEKQTIFDSGFRRLGATLPSGPSRQFSGNIQSNLRYGPESRGYWGGRGNGRTYHPAVGNTDASGASSILETGVDYYLLRFFDFTVQQGKKYKYRVKLAIADPNYNMPVNTLAPEVLDRQARAAKANHGRRPIFRLTETWSEPSPAVGITIGGSIRLVGAKLPSPEKFSDEPSASLLIEAFALDESGNAIKAATEEQNFRRGSVANLIKDTEYLGPGYIDYREDFRFFTGMTLLDIDGGEKLSRDYSAPSRILLMGPTGQLSLHNEGDDEPFVEQHRMLFGRPNSKNLGASGQISRRPR